MVVAHGGDYSRDAARYYRLVNAIRQSTTKLQQIGRDERASPDETLRSLLEELVEALTAEIAFIAEYAVDSTGQETLEIVQTVNNPTMSSQIVSPDSLSPVDPLRKVVLTGSSVVIAPSNPERAPIIPGLEAFAARSAILLRIKTLEANYLVGICNALEPEDDPFIVSDRVTAEHILELAAVGIRAIERQRRDFKFIREIFEPADSEKPYRSQLDHIVENARAAFEAEAVSMMLWRLAEAELRVEASRGLSYDYCSDQRILRKTALALLTMESLDNGEYKPFVIENLQETPLGDRQLILEEELHSVLCAPLTVKDRIGNGPGEFIGVLNIYSKGRLRNFTAVEKDFAQIFAEQSALAVQASRLLAEQRRQQSAIQEIGKAVTQGNAQTVWKVISRNAAELTSATYATLVRLRRDSLHGSGRHILAPAGTWYAGELDSWINEPWTLPYSNDSLIGRVIGNNNEEYLPDVDAAPGQFQSLMDPIGLPPISVKSACCVPLSIDEQAIGALYIASDRADAFTPHDQEILRLIAPHAAIALRNVDLKELDTKAIEFQTSIADVMNPRDQAKQIVTNLKHAGYDVSGCFLALINRQTQKLEFLYAADPGSDASTKENELRYAKSRLGTCRGLIEWVIDNNSSLLVHDFDTDMRRQAIDPVCRQGVKSCLAIPMRVNGKSIGILGLRSYLRTNAYDERDQELLEKLAPHIAVVLANSQQYSEKVRGLQAVSKYQQELSLLDTSKPYAIVDQEIENIYEHARRTIKGVGMLTDHMFIALYNDATHRIEYRLIYEDNRRIDSGNSQSPSYRDRQLGEYQDFTEWLIRAPERTPLLFENRQQMEDWGSRTRSESGMQIELPSRSKSWLAAPMVAKGKLIGVIGLRSFQHESIFNQGHKELMQVLANQAAIAVENARLYDESKNTTAVALMGAWGADIAHDVHRESQNIQWATRRLARLIAQAESAEDIPALLESIRSSAEELSLPPLPGYANMPDEKIEMGRTPILQRALLAEIEHQQKKSRQVSISSNLGIPDLRVRMDEQWIRRLLRHFINNASRHLNRERGDGHITVSVEIAEELAKIMVEDNGYGVRPEIQPMLFRAPTPHADKRKDQHFGRGLMLVRFVALMYGGDAKLEWTLQGSGSCFSFSVPIVSDVEVANGGREIDDSPVGD